MRIDISPVAVRSRNPLEVAPASGAPRMPLAAALEAALAAEKERTTTITRFGPFGAPSNAYAFHFAKYRGRRILEYHSTSPASVPETDRSNPRGSCATRPPANSDPAPVF